MVKISEIINYTLLAGGGYLIYKNWIPLKRLGTAFSTGASALISGSIGLLEGAGDKLAQLKESSPQEVTEVVTKDFEKKAKSCQAFGWNTPEEIAKCQNLDYVKRGIINKASIIGSNKLDDVKKTTTPKKTPSSSSSSSSSSSIKTKMKNKPVWNPKPIKVTYKKPTTNFSRSTSTKSTSDFKKKLFG